MEFVKKALVQIQEHLGSLNARDKILFLLILVLMGLAFVWLIVGTATPELIPLLEQDFSAGEVASIQNQLDTWGVTYQVEGNKILVRRQDRDRLLARLQLAGALPKDMREGWRKYIEESDMWLTSEDRQRRWQLALEQRLAQVVAMMDDVHDAHVIINQGSRRLLSDGPSSDPSASVYLQMRGGNKPSKHLVMAVADLVSGAVDRLTRDRVNIVADGSAYRAPGSDSAFGGDLLDRRREYERHFVDKVVHVLGIPDALVEVYVELESEKVHTEEQKLGEPVVSKEHEIKSTNSRGDSGGEPGVRPNVGVALASSAEQLEQSTEKESETEFNNERDKTTIVRQTLPDEVKSIQATVNVPRSYFLQVYRDRTGSEEKPSPEQLDTLIQTQLAEIRKTVLPVIGGTDLNQVQASWYYERQTPGAEAATAATAGAGGTVLPGGVMEYAKPAGLLVLALSSLAMVLMMLRKASSSISLPRTDLEALNEPPPALESDQGPVGEAGQTEGVLQGVEVDEDTVRVRNMAEQVATLVKEDPDSAASLVRQWIVQDK
ncbi:MAG: hypothetical protein GXY33_11435 [Phycisphaerae bacterium]|nr:hypothetical protein [Phycisphaerae bacterium]